MAEICAHALGSDGYQCLATYVLYTSHWTYPSTTELLQARANEYEQAVSGHLTTHAGVPLPKRCRSRSQRLQPLKQEIDPPICKPSREGEVCPHSTMVGAAVRCWFKTMAQTSKPLSCCESQQNYTIGAMLLCGTMDNDTQTRRIWRIFSSMVEKSRIPH